MGEKKTKEKIKNQIWDSLSQEEKQTRKRFKINLIICFIYAVIIELYFISLNVNSMLVLTQSYEIYTKISYTLFIVIAIIMFEVAYREKIKIIAINGIEFLALAIHILLIERITTLFSINTNSYIILTSLIWPVYYLLKAIIIQTKENQRRLKETSDIAEIVKEEKPVKKVAKKRKK